MLRRLVCAFALLLSAPPATAETVAGHARVSDGDTLRIGDARIRLHGIDAPELDQTCTAGGRGWACGDWARGRLARLAEGRQVACTVVEVDAYGRLVAVCSAAGRDLGAAMVAEGAALAYRRYSDRYLPEEAAARRAGLGIWRGGFEAPEAHRHADDDPGDSPVAGPGGCAIKGNVSASGRRLYHVPGGRDYDATRIDTDRGERWFCTEAEARAAGWTRAR